ncbi:hypothetical protein DOY81_008208 [Sarcophaga bullata]|nr:hypothetical protein DOY81_008208 [Sarcophaga bullata]
MDLIINVYIANKQTNKQQRIATIHNNTRHLKLQERKNISIILRRKKKQIRFFSLHNSQSKKPGNYMRQQYQQKLLLKNHLRE